MDEVRQATDAKTSNEIPRKAGRLMNMGSLLPMRRRTGAEFSGLARFERGQKLQNLVDKAAGY